MSVTRSRRHIHVVARSDVRLLLQPIAIQDGELQPRVSEDAV